MSGIMCDIVSFNTGNCTACIQYPLTGSAQGMSSGLDVAGRRKCYHISIFYSAASSFPGNCYPCVVNFCMDPQVIHKCYGEEENGTPPKLCPPGTNIYSFDVVWRYLCFCMYVWQILQIKHFGEHVTMYANVWSEGMETPFSVRVHLLGMLRKPVQRKCVVDFQKFAANK